MTQLPGVTQKSQIVCHVDVDCFYAACERLKDSNLEGEPVVVGMGYESGQQHGAVATASYEAREFGIESAMPISEALEKLPRRSEIDFENPDSPPVARTGFYRPVDMEFYESVSKSVKTVLERFATTVRNVSIDEAYLDLGDLTWEEASSFGKDLKELVHETAGVTVSVGIAPDMTTAKLASDADKPDGLVVVPPNEVQSFLAPIDVSDLHGVGPVTASKLREMGFETAGDIAAGNEATLIEAFGERGREIYRQARGEDVREVEPRGRPKSVSTESSLTEATTDYAQKQDKLRSLAREITDRSKSKGILYRTIGIKVVIPPFDIRTRERSLSGPVDDPELVESIAINLLEEFREDPIRKLGIRLSNLSFDERQQTAIGDYEHLTQENVSNSSCTPRDSESGNSVGKPVIISSPGRQVKLTEFID